MDCWLKMFLFTVDPTTGHWLICGGHVGNGMDDSICSALNPVDEKWYSIPKMETGRSSSGGAVVQNTWVVPGGEGGG